MSAIDFNYLANISDNDRDFEAELLRIYIEDTELHLEAAQTSLAAGEWDKLAKEGHHIKGASANVGAQPMQALAARLEQEAKCQSPDRLALLLTEMTAELEKVKQLFNSRYSP